MQMKVLFLLYPRARLTLKPSGSHSCCRTSALATAAAFATVGMQPAPQGGTREPWGRAGAPCEMSKRPSCRSAQEFWKVQHKERFSKGFRAPRSPGGRLVVKVGPQEKM